MSKFANRTSVSVSKSKAEVEATLERYGAQQFLSGWDENNAFLAFRIDVGGGQFRHIRFSLPMPNKHDKEFTHHSRGVRTADAALKEWEQACRQRWRALALVIKAKLEAVECGISTIEDEFLAQTVMADGNTVSHRVQGKVALEYSSGKMQNLLPHHKGDK